MTPRTSNVCHWHIHLARWKLLTHRQSLSTCLSELFCKIISIILLPFVCFIPGNGRRRKAPLHEQPNEFPVRVRWQMHERSAIRIKRYSNNHKLDFSVANGKRSCSDRSPVECCVFGTHVANLLERTNHTHKMVD